MMRTTEPRLGLRLFCARNVPTAPTTSCRVSTRYAITTNVTPRSASLMVFSTLGISMALSGGVVCAPLAAYHRQSATFSMPVARISHARLTRRASTARAAGASHADLSQGGLGLASAGRFSVLVHGGISHG